MRREENVAVERNLCISDISSQNGTTYSIYLVGTSESIINVSEDAAKRIYERLGEVLNEKSTN